MPFSVHHYVAIMRKPRFSITERRGVGREGAAERKRNESPISIIGLNEGARRDEVPISSSSCTIVLLPLASL